MSKIMYGQFTFVSNKYIISDLNYILRVVSAILLYRICRCCRRIYVKLLHTVFHALAIPCVAVGFLAVLDSHNLAQPRPIANFYSLHSWIGLVTMGLFAIQVGDIIAVIVVYETDRYFNEKKER